MSSVDTGLPASFAYQRDESIPGNVILIGVDLTLIQDLMPAGRVAPRK